MNDVYFASANRIVFAVPVESLKSQINLWHRSTDIRFGGNQRSMSMKRNLKNEKPDFFFGFLLENKRCSHLRKNIK